MIELLDRPASGPAIRLHPDDNVLIARTVIELGARLPDGIVSRSQVPAGHKIAARSIARDEPIRKYNVTIGFASADIPAGTYVHSHNMEFREFQRDYAHAQDYRPVEMIPQAERATFMGIVRENGQVATRNFIGVLATVNCSATVAHRIAAWFTPERLADYPNVDGVVAFAHGTGCGMELTGEPMDLLRRTMAGYATHANLAGALIVGLGCERNQVSKLLAAQGLAEGSRLRSFVMQDEGGTTKTVAAGIAAVKEMLPEANRVTRTRVSASHLMVGLQCGGSDGFSSITANPALGAAVDLLVRHGGTAILSETPEIYGVEHTLTRRARSREVGEKLIERIRWWKEEYTVGRDTQINGVVSPGNQSGGLANIFEKSLGSSMKGGGANLIAFTTGRGSMFGAKPSPSIKLATNTPMYNRLTEDMDINCGGILDGTHTLAQMGQEIFEHFLRVASGEKTRSELLGLGDHEFIPWNIGVTG
jgi:altronate hydrolase